MKKPCKTVRVLGNRIRIAWDADLGDKWGLFDPEAMVISVAASDASDTLREATLHEIIHALDHQMQFKLTEGQVRQLSIGLFSLFRDNKTLMAWLMEDDGDE